jgi:uncharacterized protein DUF2563
MLVCTGLLHSEADLSHRADRHADRGANRRPSQQQIGCGVLAARDLWP